MKNILSTILKKLSFKFGCCAKSSCTYNEKDELQPGSIVPKLYNPVSHKEYKNIISV